MKKLFITNVILLFSINLFSQTANLSYEGGQNYIFTERTDLRRYDNGKYKGLVSREVKSFIVPKEYDNGYKYDGLFYVSQDTKRASNIVFSGIHDAIKSSFTISKDGELSMIEDCGFPSFRSFPVYPSKEVKIGDEWTGTLIRSVDPLEKNKPTKIKSTVVYKYNGEKTYRNEEVFVVNAQWATRYNLYSDDGDLYGDNSLLTANGKHNAEILISKKTGNAILIRDNLDESFKYSDGNLINFKGNIALFTEYPPAIDNDEIIPVKTEDFDYEITPAGIKYSICLNFEADSDELVKEDKNKVILLANVLKSYGQYKYIIEGHTADVGNNVNDDELSLRRAHAVLHILENQGLSKDNFICIGSGCSKPVADNSTEEGRKKNRRVEVTVLGDIKNK